MKLCCERVGVVRVARVQSGLFVPMHNVVPPTRNNAKEETHKSPHRLVSIHTAAHGDASVEATIVRYRGNETTSDSPALRLHALVDAQGGKVGKKEAHGKD